MAQQRQRFEQLAARLWWQRSRLAEFPQCRCGAAAHDLRRRRGLTQHQVLHDEFEVQQPARTVLEVPGRGPRVLLRDAPSHVGDIGHEAPGVAGRAQHLADYIGHPSA